MKTKLLIIAALSVIFVSVIYLIYEDIIKEQKVQDAFGDNPVYLAMKENFPDMESFISHGEETGTGMYAHVVNSTNGNEMYLTLYKGDSKWGNSPTSITCRTVNGIDSQYTDDFVAEYIKSTDCLNIGEDSDIVHFAPMGQITKNDMENIFEMHPAYIAMKQRFPDSADKTEYFDGDDGGKLRVNTMSSEKGNHLELTISIDKRLDTVPAFTVCYLDNGNIALQQKYNFLAEHIAETDCLDYSLDPNYIHPRYDGPVDEDDGILLIKDTAEYKTLAEEYGEDMVSVKAVNLINIDDTLFLKYIDDGFRQNPGCIIVMEYEDGKGSIYQLNENLDIVHKMNLAEFMEKSAKNVDVHVMDGFYDSLR